MIIAMQSSNMNYGKQLSLSTNYKEKTINYTVCWTIAGHYQSKEFAEGEFAAAVDFFNAIDVTAPENKEKEQ